MNFAGRLGVLVIAVLGLLAAMPTLGTAQEPADQVEQIRARLDQLERQAAQPTGRAIYVAACATCHGVHGDGNGREGARLVFPPTDFRRGVFKLRSTAFERLPMDADLERTIREGMSGTEMVPFKELLTPDSIRRVAAYIKTLSPRFSNREELSEKEKDIVAIPAARPFPPSAESAAAGQEVYEREECGTCHGESGDGRGEDAEGMTDDWERPIFMFDWARGMFKSGTQDQDLYRSISTGMNGTPMEAYSEDVTEEERWQLVDFVRSLERKPGGLGWVIDFLFVQRPSGLNYEAR